MTEINKPTIAVQTLLRLMEFMIQINLEHHSIAEEIWFLLFQGLCFNKISLTGATKNSHIESKRVLAGNEGFFFVYIFTKLFSIASASLLIFRLFLVLFCRKPVSNYFYNYHRQENLK